MIASIRGEVIDIALDHAVIEAAGVGYKVMATPSTLATLRRGGNAADAAVAMAAAMAVTEPTSGGLGGDCFAIVRDAATGEVSALNGSGRAPRDLSLERLAREVAAIERIDEERATAKLQEVLAQAA